MLTYPVRYSKPGGSPDGTGAIEVGMKHATKTVAANDRAIKAMKAIEGERTTERKVAGIPGLWLYIYPTGRKAFHVHYSVRIGAKQVKRKPRLGEYGDRGPVTLSDARRRALEMMGRVEAGRDPVAEDAIERAARRRAVLTFSDMVDDYIVDHRAQGHATTKDIRQINRSDWPGLIWGGWCSSIQDGTRRL